MKNLLNYFVLFLFTSSLVLFNGCNQYEDAFEEKHNMLVHKLDNNRKHRIDVLDTDSFFDITLFSHSGAIIVVEPAPITIKSDRPDGKPSHIDIEIVAMSLVSSSPIPSPPTKIKIGRSFGLPPSTGKTTPSGPHAFPAESFFDVFVEIEVGGFLLHNEEPFRVESVINEIPPYGETYTYTGPPIPLFDVDSIHLGELNLARIFILPRPDDPDDDDDDRGDDDDDNDEEEEEEEEEDDEDDDNDEEEDDEDDDTDE